MNLSGLTSTVIKKDIAENLIKSRSILLNKKSIGYLEAATRLHMEALKHLEKSNWKKAKRSALKAHDHVALAIEAQKKDQRLMASPDPHRKR
jgi:hypothetical protein